IILDYTDPRETNSIFFNFETPTEVIEKKQVNPYFPNNMKHEHEEVFPSIGDSNAYQSSDSFAHVSHSPLDSIFAMSSGLDHEDRVYSLLDYGQMTSSTSYLSMASSHVSEMDHMFWNEGFYTFVILNGRLKLLRASTSLSSPTWCASCKAFCSKNL
nr:DNA-binding WRKY [Tanacetum cinerariifolium]